MRGCGTTFVLSEGERFELNQLERIAARHEFIAVHLKHAVEQCRQQQTMEGIGDMVAFAFNAQAFTPSYGGGGANLPPGKYKGVIVDTRQEKTNDGKGGYLALDLTPIEGPLAGQKHTDRLNLHNLNPQTVEIANKQLSAYCYCVGQFNIQDTVQLHNIPFYFEIGFQKGHEPTAEKPEGGYTEVKAIYDINGNSPGKTGGTAAVAAAPAPVAAPPAAVAPTAAPAAGWGAPAPAEAPAPAPAAAPPAAAPPAAAWGGPPAAETPAAASAPAASALPPGWG